MLLRKRGKTLLTSQLVAQISVIRSCTSPRHQKSHKRQDGDVFPNDVAVLNQNIQNLRSCFDFVVVGLLYTTWIPARRQTIKIPHFITFIRLTAVFWIILLLILRPKNKKTNVI